MRVLLFIAAILLASPAAAQSVTALTVGTLRGQCQALLADTEDLIGICADEIMQVVYVDQRMDLAIWTESPSGRLLVFSGPATEGNGGLVQQIDKVIEGQDGSGDSNIEHFATGQCILSGNPADAPVQITCEATDTDGAIYKFAFLTDGIPESMLD